ncbi:MAG: hypothetical protein J6D30_01630 [Clostridia bacterium]|nr:hypothetical protein [Clostridia bacterium]
MWSGSVVRNVSFLNVVTGDRCGVVANMVTNGALIENVYVEATVVKEGVNTNNTNPAGVLAQKVTAGGTVRNCVLNLTVNEGVKADVDSKNANAWAFRAAAFGQIAGTVDNVQVIYDPFEGQELPYSITGTATNSAIYANIAEFYAEGGADLTKYTDSGWHFEAGFMPYYGNMKPADLAITGESEVYQGNSVTLIPPKASTLSLKEAIDGVTLKGNTITVDAAVAADTKITVVASSKYWADTCEFVVTVKANAYALEMAKKSYSFIGFVGDELPTETLSYSLTMNGAAYDGEVTFESANEAVAIVENGVLKVVGDGATKIAMKLGDVDLGEISVSVELYNKVTTTAEFLAIGKDATSMAKKYMLMNDLDFEGATVNGFSSYNSKATITFKGVFDGNGHTISNIVIGKPVNPAANDYAIFGYMEGNAAVRNLSIIGAKVAERSGVIANWMQDNAVVENIFVEVEYTKTVGANTNNPAGGIVAKMQTATTTLRNSIIVWSVADGVVPSTTHGLVASLVVAGATIDNCQAIYGGTDITTLVSNDKGAKITNSAIYANLDAFYAAEGGADLTKYGEGWNFTAGLMPYYGTMKPADFAITGENEVYQGNSVTLNAPKACTLSLKDAIDGVTISGNTVTVDAAVAADTKITVVASSVYFADTCEFEITVKANAYGRGKKAQLHAYERYRFR